jgi:hypothetical protein
MGSPRYFKIQIRSKDLFVGVLFVAVATSFVWLSIWAQGTAMVAMVAASASFGAAVGASPRRS